MRINAFLPVSYRAQPHTGAIKLDGNDDRILSVIALFSFEKPHHVIEACLVLLHEPKECAIFRDFYDDAVLLRSEIEFTIFH